MKEYIDKELGINDYCFGCGESNPIGAKLNFYKISEKSLGADFEVPDTWGGWGKIAHGGLQTVLLDEVSGWAMITLLEKTGLTVKVEMNFLKPVYVEDTIKIVGEIQKVEGRDIFIQGYIHDSAGDICTKGLFTFKEVKKEKIESLADIKFSS